MLRRVELPLAVPYLAAGFRTAAVQVVATATLAAFVNGGGLGRSSGPGFGLDIAAGGGQIIAGGVLVAGLGAAASSWSWRWSSGWSRPRPLRRARGGADRRAADAVTGGA